MQLADAVDRPSPTVIGFLFISSPTPWAFDYFSSITVIQPKTYTMVLNDNFFYILIDEVYIDSQHLLGFMAQYLHDDPFWYSLLDIDCCS